MPEMNFGVFIHGRAWHWQDLVRAAESRHSLTRLDLRNSTAFVNYQRNQVTSELAGDLDQYDAMLVLGVPAGSLEQVILRMDLLLVLASSGIPVLNPPKSIEACVDKYLALARLQKEGLPVPATHVCQTARQGLHSLRELGGRAVCKPIFGSEGRGIELIDDEQAAAILFEQMEQAGRAIYLQEFITHPGWDLRLFVIGEQTFAMRRENRNDWRTNASRGAVTTPHFPNRIELEMARAAAEAVGARIAGVDLMYDVGNQPVIVEVNSAPGWRHLSATIGVDIAAAILNELQQTAEQVRQN